MRGSSRLMCAFCGTRVWRRKSVLGRHRMRTPICRRCYADWFLGERLCAGCQRPVAETQHVGVFIEREGFGHPECGAVPLTSTPAHEIVGSRLVS